MGTNLLSCVKTGKTNQEENQTMKKIIALLMVLAMVFALVACQQKPAEQPQQEQRPRQNHKFEITMLFHASSLLRTGYPPDAPGRRF